MKINFGVRLPNSGPLALAENILKIGEAADRHGFNALTTHDHVTHGYGERYHNSGGFADVVDEQSKAGLPVTNFYETIATLSVLAGKTESVRLIPCSAVLPWRHPVLFAKQLVTLHELSGGRAVLCGCIGNIANDFKAMNVNYKLKGRIMNEYLEVLKLILSDSREVSFEGRFVRFPKFEFDPKPSRKLPIWIAGYFGDKAFERVAKFGDGFLAGQNYPEAYRDGVPKLMQYLKQRGRDINEIEVGGQNFLCLMKDGNEARKRSQYTIECFFHGPEFDVPDPNNPGKTSREVMMTRTVNGAFVGSPDEVIKKADEYAANGVRFIEMRLMARTVSDATGMLDLFATQVMPSFSR